MCSHGWQHGPQEDTNPIIDYIIKSHKYKQDDGRARSGGALSSARPDSGSLAQVLLDTRAYNQAEDEKQLDGAHRQLASQGVLHRPMLLSTKLSQVDNEHDGDDRAYAPQHSRTYAEQQSSADQQLAPPRQYSSQPLMPRPNYTSTRGASSKVSQWLHDRYDRNSRSRSRSRSNSRSHGRSRSRSRSWGGRDEPAAQRGRQAQAPRLPLPRRATVDPGEAAVVVERPSPTYDEYC